MSAYERARAAFDSLAALNEERRERIALALLDIIEVQTGGGALSCEDFAALDAALSAGERIGSPEEIEALFKTLLR